MGAYKENARYEMVSFRTTAERKDALQAGAKGAGVSLSEFMDGLLQLYLREKPCIQKRSLAA